jgi:hypothetical protein
MKATTRFDIGHAIALPLTDEARAAKREELNRVVCNQAIEAAHTKRPV